MLKSVRRNAGVTTDRSGNVVSTGRQTPITPHSLVVALGSLDRSEYARRSTNPDPEFPLGQESDFNAEKGELAFTITDSREPIINNPNTIDRKVSTTLNGLSSDRFLISYAGQIANSAHLNSGTHVDLTLVIAGPITVRVSGSDYIAPGSMVRVQWPQIVNQGGRLVPYYTHASRTKFLLEVVPEHYYDVAHQFFHITDEILKRLKPMLDNDGKLQAGEAPQALALLSDVHEPYTPYRGRGARTAPMKRYAEFMVYKLGAVDNNTEWMTDANREMSQLQSGGTRPRLGRVPRGPRAQAPLPVTAVDDERMRRFVHIFPFLIMAEQGHLYDQLLLGKAMTAGIPKQSVDVVTGYFH